MSQKVLGMFAVCLVAAACALPAQTLFVEPGATSSGQNVEALAPSPVSSITGFQAGAGTYLVLEKADGSKFYAIDSSTNQSITEFDHTFLVPRNIAALTQPATAAVLTPDGSRLAVAAGTLHIFDTASDTDLIAGGINVGAPISVVDVTVSLDGKTLYSLGVGGGSSQVNAIDVATNLVTGLMGFDGLATSISVGPNGLIYVTLTNEVVEINPSTFTQNPAGPISMNARPGRPAFTPDGKYAVFANQTPSTGSSVLLVSLANRAVVSTLGSLQIALDTLLVSGTDTILGYASATQTIYQISISSTGNLGISAYNVPGSANSASAITLSDEVPIGGRSFVNSVYVIANGDVEQLDAQSGQLKSQSALPTGVAAGALSFTRAATTGTVPVTLLQFGGGQLVAHNATSQPLVVRVLDTNSLPISGVTVAFSTNGSGSTVSPTSVTTSSNGYAITYLTAGSTDGPLQVTATAGNHTIEFNMSVGINSGGTAGGLSFVSGQGQILPAGYNTNSGIAGAHLSVLVTDETNKPLPGAPVTFLITQGDGTLFLTGGGGKSQTVNSDSSGVATVDFLASEVQGPDATRGFAQTEVFTSAPGTNSLTFTITIVPINAPATIQQIQPDPGSQISGQVNQIIPGAVHYQITSNTGSPIPGVGVILNTGGLNPALYPSAHCNDPNGTGVLSDGSGKITCDLVIGPRVGRVNIIANVGYSINMTPFPLLVTAGPPATVKLVQGNNQTGQPGAMLPIPLVVQVADVGGNVLAGDPVTWQVVTPGAATLSSVISTTDVNGHASAVVTLGNIAGAFQVTLTAGSASATFSLATIVPSSGIQKVSGDGQSAVTNTGFNSPLVVEVIGNDGNAVAGALVNFQITAGSGTLSSPSGFSGDNGQVSTTVQAGATPGPLTVTATTATFSVTFNLTVRLPGPTDLAIVNGASFLTTTGISPGGIAVVTGLGILPGVSGLVLANNFVGPLPTSLEGVSITFNGVAAPIYYVMNSGGVEQVAIQVPFEALPAGATAAANVTVVVTASSGTPATISVLVKPFAPGIFTTSNGGQIWPVAQRPDGSYVSPTNPAQLGENITLYVTGLGAVSPATITGNAGIPGQAVVAPLIIGLNNSGVPLISANYVQGLTGVYAVTFHVPANTATGSAQPLAVVAYDTASHAYFGQGIKIAVAAPAQ